MLHKELEALEKLYKAVNAYCTASAEAKKPIPESYWRAVTLAWQEAKKLREGGNNGKNL